MKVIRNQVIEYTHKNGSYRCDMVIDDHITENGLSIAFALRRWNNKDMEEKGFNGYKPILCVPWGDKGGWIEMHLESAREDGHQEIMKKLLHWHNIGACPNPWDAIDKRLIVFSNENEGLVGRICERSNERVGNKEDDTWIPRYRYACRAVVAGYDSHYDYHWVVNHYCYILGNNELSMLHAWV